MNSNSKNETYFITSGSTINNIPLFHGGYLEGEIKISFDKNKVKFTLEKPFERINEKSDYVIQINADMSDFNEIKNEKGESVTVEIKKNFNIMAYSLDEEYLGGNSFNRITFDTNIIHELDGDIFFITT